jgi:hypothetical protein
MEFFLILVAPILGSAAIGFALNRFVIRRIARDPARALASAAARAVFYAPSLVHFGHGVHLPAPLLLVLVYSQRQFGPELGLLTFVLPGCVFVASLAAAWSRRFGLWFCGLVTAHLILFCFLPFALPSFEARLALFSVNAFPWYPLHHFLHLPVTEYGGLTLPNEIGWVWCLAVWLALYALLAAALARLTFMSFGVQK